MFDRSTFDPIKAAKIGNTDFEILSDLLVISSYPENSLTVTLSYPISEYYQIYPLGSVRIFYWNMQTNQWSLSDTIFKFELRGLLFSTLLHKPYRIDLNIWSIVWVIL